MGVDLRALCGACALCEARAGRRADREADGTELLLEEVGDRAEVLRWHAATDHPAAPRRRASSAARRPLTQPLP